MTRCALLVSLSLISVACTPAQVRYAQAGQLAEACRESDVYWSREDGAAETSAAFLGPSELRVRFEPLSAEERASLGIEAAGDLWVIDLEVSALPEQVRAVRFGSPRLMNGWTAMASLRPWDAASVTRAGLVPPPDRPGAFHEPAYTATEEPQRPTFSRARAAVLTPLRGLRTGHFVRPASRPPSPAERRRRLQRYEREHAEWENSEEERRRAHAAEVERSRAEHTAAVEGHGRAMAAREERAAEVAEVLNGTCQRVGSPSGDPMSRGGFKLELGAAQSCRAVVSLVREEGRVSGRARLDWPLVFVARDARGECEYLRRFSATASDGQTAGAAARAFFAGRRRSLDELSALRR